MHTQCINPKLTILRGSDLTDVRANNTLFSEQHTVRGVCVLTSKPDKYPLTFTYVSYHVRKWRFALGKSMTVRSKKKIHGLCVTCSSPSWKLAVGLENGAGCIDYSYTTTCLYNHLLSPNDRARMGVTADECVLEQFAGEVSLTPRLAFKRCF